MTHHQVVIAKRNITSLFIVKAILLSALLFFNTSIYSQNNTSKYRIQINALPRVKPDSVKLLCDEARQKFLMNTYLLDADNYYKILLGDFNSFKSALNKLDLIRIYHHDAWITPSLHELVIYSSEVKQMKEYTEDGALVSRHVDADGYETKIENETDEVSQLDIVYNPISVIGSDEPALMIKEVSFEIPDIEKSKSKRIFWKLYGSGVFVDLHAHTPEMKFCTYYGLGVGTGFAFAFTKNFAFDLTADYNFAGAVPLFEKHELTGNASVLRVNPSFAFGTNIYSRNVVYGKIGLSYFNYDYAYNLELKPGYEGGPARVEAELLERAYTYGLDFGVGVRLFRYLDITFITYLDQNTRRFHAVNLGIIL